MSIRDLQKLCNANSVSSGWWEGSDVTNLETAATKLCLVHSEISEAMEGLRKDLNDDHLPHRKMVEVELADAVIRILDLSGQMGLDLEGAIYEKLEYNAHRNDHKKENRNSINGKKF